jgi:4-hydroxybenzoate polyprenyltransferase
MILLETFTERYIAAFELVFTYVTPLIKLFVLIYGAIYGLNLLVDLAWIIHQIRKNAEDYEDKNKGA